MRRTALKHVTTGVVIAVTLLLLLLGVLRARAFEPGMEGQEPVPNSLQEAVMTRAGMPGPPTEHLSLR